MHYVLKSMQNLVWICIDMPQVRAATQKFDFNEKIVRIFGLN